MRSATYDYVTYELFDQFLIYLCAEVVSVVTESSSKATNATGVIFGKCISWT